MRNSGSWLWILPRMVLALYSCLGEVTQQGTMLWASTWEAKPQRRSRKQMRSKWS